MTHKTDKVEVTQAELWALGNAIMDASPNNRWPADDRDACAKAALDWIARHRIEATRQSTPAPAGNVVADVAFLNCVADDLQMAGDDAGYSDAVSVRGITKRYAALSAAQLYAPKSPSEADLPADFIHRMPTSLDPSLEGPSEQADQQDEIVANIVRDVCELPGDDDPAADDTLILSVDDLTAILQRNLAALNGSQSNAERERG